MKALLLVLILAAAPASALTVVIDAGHGGEDPGAVKGGLREADLTLAIAKVLAEALRAKGANVALTRDQPDQTLPLTARLETTRNAGADLLISLHADSLLIGSADGLSIYTHANRPSGEVTDALLRQELASELLFGPIAGQPESDVAGTLLDLADARTQKLTTAFAEQLANDLSLAGIELYQRPIQSGDFVVLRSPAIPAVLIELGFLDSHFDRKRLTDGDWQKRFAQAASKAIIGWAKANGID